MIALWISLKLEMSILSEVGMHIELCAARV